MHYDTRNQEGRICIGSCLNFPVDMVAAFVISQYFDSQREPRRQAWYIHEYTRQQAS